MLVKLGLFPQGRDDHKKIFWVATTQLSKIIPNILKQKKGHDLRLFNGGSHCCLRKNILGPCNKILNLTRFIWMFPKIVGFHPKSSIFLKTHPKSSIFLRVFHYFHHPFWGFSPYLWFNTHINVPFRPHHHARSWRPLLPGCAFPRGAVGAWSPVAWEAIFSANPRDSRVRGEILLGLGSFEEVRKKSTKKFEKGKEVVSIVANYICKMIPSKKKHISYSNSIFATGEELPFLFSWGMFLGG